MPKSRKRKKKETPSHSVDWGGGYWAVTSIGGHRDFNALISVEAGVLDGVRTDPNDGRDHVNGAITYASDFPTSGRHRPVWAPAGVYERPQPKPELVHALEHGNIVIYYETPSPEAWQRITDWADLFGGRWDGIVVTPFRGLGESVVPTAWTKTLRLDQWDPVVAATFIDTYRGRGPENPVR